MDWLLGAAFGIVVGLLSAAPGVHVTVLLIGLMPLLGINGQLGACAMMGALGSSMACTVLAKTFHPATEKTVRSATPEQVMAYQGNGPLAIAIQIQAVWVGVGLVLAIAIPVLLISVVTGKDIAHLIWSLSPYLWILIAIFFAGIIFQAKKHRLTLIVILIGTLLGFYTIHSPAMSGNPTVLAPLLGGIFGLPGLMMVIGHRGKVKSFPNQHAPKSLRFVKHWRQWQGALGGILTAMTAGLGSGAAISLLAKKVRHEEYLGMHTASEAANHVFAILLFLVVGSAHAGSVVALKQDLGKANLWMGLLMLFLLLVGLYVGTYVTKHVIPTYVKVVTHLPQRTLSVVVTLFTLWLIWSETGSIGLVIAVTSGLLGLAARLYHVPNQALVSVLAGPVLVQHLGLSHVLASWLSLSN